MNVQNLPSFLRDKQPTYEWHCETCGKTKRFGAGSLSCGIDAARHHRRYLEHEVIIREITVTHRFKAQMDSLPLGVADDPPF